MAVVLCGFSFAVHLPALFAPAPDPSLGGFPDLVLTTPAARGPAFSASGGPVPPGQPTLLYPPLYPAAAGALVRTAGAPLGLHVVRVLQLAAAAATTVIWFGLALTLVGKIRPAAAFAALAALDPGLWSAPAWLEPTVVFQLTLAVLLLAAARWRGGEGTRAFVIMIAAGLLLPLLRSALLEYVLLLSLVTSLQCWRARGHGFRRWTAPVFPLLVVLLVATWGAWNSDRLGRFKLTSSSGLASVCTGPPLGAALQDSRVPFRPHGDHRSSPSQEAWVTPRPEPECQCEAPCDEADWDTELRDVMGRSLAEDPRAGVVRALRGVSQTVLPVDVDGVIELIVGGLLAMALAAAANRSGRRDPKAAGIALLVFHVLAIALVFPPTAERAAIVRPALLLPLLCLLTTRVGGRRDDG